MGCESIAIDSEAMRARGIDLVTVFDAILTSRQTCEKLQCLHVHMYENLMSNNFRKTVALKKILIVTVKLQSKGLH